MNHLQESLHIVNTSSEPLILKPEVPVHAYSARFTVKIYRTIWIPQLDALVHPDVTVWLGTEISGGGVVVPFVITEIGKKDQNGYLTRL